MRFRIGGAFVLLTACGSFGSPPDVAAAPDASDDAVASVDAGSAADAGRDGDAACAARRCIDFEAPAQSQPPYGFDDVIDDRDGGVAIGEGYLSPNALVAHSISDKREFGIVSFNEVPSRVSVRLRVRPLDWAKNDGTSVHFIVFVCANGDNLVVKMNYDGEISTQIAQDGTPFAQYTKGTWYQVEATATFGVDRHALSAVVDGTTSSVEKVANNVCTSPMQLRIGGVVQGGSAGEFTLAVDDVMVDWN